MNPGPITAVLGPTNTGKTHYALERMLAHRSGMIGLPLRLLAREVYDRIIAQRGSQEVALVTGEEKIIPPSPRYWVCTVEAMPLEREVDFLAIDEVQLAADLERGRIFTSRLLHARGKSETLLLGSDTIWPVLRKLYPDATLISRPRFSALNYSGPKKVTRLPRRSAIVAFSSDAVYAIAELIRRQRGGAAVVLGALSPRTRNAQAALYQNGEVDYLVATDAIGMGLNMDIDHVAFAATRKFDGRGMRNLLPAELAQIAGRAGRHVRDGTFGTTADCPDLDKNIVDAIENHHFEPVSNLQWRSEALDFSTLPALLNSFERSPPHSLLRRSRPDDDEIALTRLTQWRDIRDMAKGGAALNTLWDVCQTPDFRKTAPDQHARLLAELYRQLMGNGRISDAWLADHIEPLDRTDGNIDTLSSRIAHIRTWTYLSHRSAWLANAGYWQDKTRVIEDSLSDVLHEKLTQRFVDRRTSVLIRRLKDDAPLLAGVNEDGEVIVEGQFVGRLLGFEFILDPRASGAEAKSVRAAADRALRPIMATRAAALANAESADLDLREDGSIWWRTAQVARLEKGPAPLRPNLRIKGLDAISPNLRGRVEDRLTDFFAAKVEALLAPLIGLQRAANAGGDNGLQGLTRGVAFRLVENFGATSREQFGDDLRQINQEERSKLRQLGVRFGEYTVFMPALLKPMPAAVLTMLWALWTDRRPHEITPPKAGLVSTQISETLPHAYYYASGYRPSGVRAVRIDMLERLAGEIRNARKGRELRHGFEATAHMMSFVGCSGEDFESILHSLGFRKHVEKRAAPTKTPTNQMETQAPPVSPENNNALENSETEMSREPTGATSSQSVSPSPVNDNVELLNAPSAVPDIYTQTPTAPSVEPTEAPADSLADSLAPNPATASAESVQEQLKSSSDEDTAKPEPVVSLTMPDNAAEAASAETEAAPVEEGPDSAGEEIEVTVWRPVPRRHPNKKAKKPQKSGDKTERKPSGARAGGKPRQNAKPDRQNFKSRPNGPQDQTRHRKIADPNSPFAVLAGLKDELSKSHSEGNQKPPGESTEKVK